MSINYANLSEIESRLNELSLQKSQIDEESRLLETIKRDLSNRDSHLAIASLVDSANSRIREILESKGCNSLVMTRIDLIEIFSNRDAADPKIIVDLKTFDNKVLIRFDDRSSLLKDWLDFIVKYIEIFQYLAVTYGEDLTDSAVNNKMIFKIEEVDIVVKFERDLSTNLMIDHFSISAERLMFRDYENTNRSLISISDQASVSASYDYLDLKFEYFVRPTSLDSISSWIERILEDHDKAKETLLF